MAQRIGWALLIAATLYICYFSNLNVIGFVGPDEPRYAWIARDMAETGDWVTPRLYGRPWFEKPPLLYWGGAIFFKTMPSQPEVAARLPSAICALIATLALAWLAWRTYGEECARWLLLLLPTSVGMIGFSHACATDMPFAGMLTVALVCAAVILGLVLAKDDTPLLPRTPWLALILFGFFLGLAVLAKGPAALILTGGAVFFWALFTKRWRDAFRLLHPAAIATFCVTALPWYILCARRNPDFFRIFIIDHNFKRYLTPEFQHIQPFWFYIPVLLIAFLPWLALSLWGFYVGLIEWRESKAIGSLALLFLFSSVFCVIFFSISRSKLPGYILPSVPLIGLLLARTVQLYNAKQRNSFIGLVLFGSILFALFAAGLVVGPVSEHPPSMSDVSGLFLGAVVFSFTLSNLLLIFARRPSTSRSQTPLSPLIATPTLVALLLSPLWLPGLFRHDLSGRTLANEIPSPSTVSQDFFAGKMSRGAQYSLNFYLHKEIPNWNPNQPKSGYLLTDDEESLTKLLQPFKCSEKSFRLPASGVFLCEVQQSDSLGGIGSGGQPKQEK